MLTAYWLNDWATQGIAAVCGVLMRIAGVDATVPNSNEDFILY